jgi:hypothetical protein
LAAAETPLTIDQLLAQGWEIAGYASGYDNRTSLILFRHPGVKALVQCGILYDVTRVQRTHIVHGIAHVDEPAETTEAEHYQRQRDCQNHRLLPRQGPDPTQQPAAATPKRT